MYLNTSSGAVVYTEYEGFVVQSALQKYKMQLGRPNEAAPIGECIGCHIVSIEGLIFNPNLFQIKLLIVKRPRG